MKTAEEAAIEYANEMFYKETSGDSRYKAFLAGVAYANQDRWISVETPPEKEGGYIIATNKGVKEGWFYVAPKYTGWHYEYGITEIIAWQPFPIPPTK